MKNKFKIGQRVQSHYRARWKGEIIDIKPRKNKQTSLITVLVDTDRKSNPIRKKFKSTLDESWLTLVK